VPDASLERAFIRTLERGELELPLKPTVVTRVLALARDPEARIEELSRLIHNDPSLAAHVIRVSNSPAYASRIRITTLTQALTRIGMRVLVELAITVGISSVFRVPGYEATAQDIWEHALTTGVFARRLAGLCGEDEELAFLCGLLHSIGRPVVLRAAVEAAASLRRPVSDAELTRLMDGWDQDVGEQLGFHWELPGPVRESIGYWDDYASAPDHRRMVALTSLAITLARYAAALSATGWRDVLQHPAIDELAIDRLALTDLLADAHDILGTVDLMAA
jgi:HD-like signal output (HDOD) protein